MVKYWRTVRPLCHIRTSIDPSLLAGQWWTKKHELRLINRVLDTVEAEMSNPRGKGSALLCRDFAISYDRLGLVVSSLVDVDVIFHARPQRGAHLGEGYGGCAPRPQATVYWYPYTLRGRQPVPVYLENAYLLVHELCHGFICDKAHTEVLDFATYIQDQVHRQFRLPTPVPERRPRV